MAGRIEVKYYNTYILKKLASAYLPNKIIDRTKVGFPVPPHLWLKRAENDFIKNNNTMNYDWFSTYFLAEKELRGIKSCKLWNP